MEAPTSCRESHRAGVSGERASRSFLCLRRRRKLEAREAPPREMFGQGGRNVEIDSLIDGFVHWLSRAQLSEEPPIDARQVRHVDAIRLPLDQKKGLACADV